MSDCPVVIKWEIIEEHKEQFVMETYDVIKNTEHYIKGITEEHQDSKINISEIRIDNNIYKYEQSIEKLVLFKPKGVKGDKFK